LGGQAPSLAALAALYPGGQAAARGTAAPAGAPAVPLTAAPGPTTTPALRPAYGRASLAFEPNVGQVTNGPQVNFLSHGPGFELFLTNASAVFSVARPGQAASGPALRDVFRLDFAGAGASPRIVTGQELPSRSSYFAGSDPRQWHTDVPQYAGLTYQDIYPGVDLVYRSHTTIDRQLEYDFVVKPGADASAVRLSWQGLQSVSLDGQGNLLLQTAGGTVV
jgi:hypothetical protein